MQTQNLFFKKYWIILAFGVGIILGMGLIFLLPSGEPTESPPHVPSPHILQLRPVNAFEPAALLPEAVIWHPAGDTALIYQPYDRDLDPIRYFWMEGTPQQWSAFPVNAAEPFAHLIWLNTDGKLWYSQIHADGSRKLLVINLVVGGAQKMVATPLWDGRLVVTWQSNIDPHALSVIIVDARGRPIQEKRLVDEADHFDMTADNEGNLHLIWTPPPLEGQRNLYLLKFTPESLEITENAVSQAAYLPMNTDANSWLDTIRVLTDDEWVYLLWGVNTAAAPDFTEFKYAAIREQEVSTGGELAVSNQFNLNLTYEDETVHLRWVGHIVDAEISVTARTVQLPMTAYIEGQWQPILVKFSEGAMAEYDILSDLSADASPPTVLVDEDGPIAAAWGRIDGVGRLVQEVIGMLRPPA